MWYSASLLFKSIQVPPTDEPLWEESIRLIQADTEDDARHMAQLLGERERCGYQTNNGTVTWIFDRVERIYAIESESIDSGIELFSRFLRNSEVESLLTPFED